MRGLILAAGRGTRLQPLTLDRPKCLLQLRGQTLMEHQLDALAAAGIHDVTVVVGHLGDRIRETIGDHVQYREFPEYAQTNNLYTLHSCRDLLDDATTVLFSDVLLEPHAYRRIVESDRDFSLLVDTTRVLDGTMRIRLEGSRVADLGGHIPPTEGDGNFVGVAGFSRRGADLLRAELERMVASGGHIDDYYTVALLSLVERGEALWPLCLGGSPWLEIDELAEYEQAKAADFYVS